jgi:hypothetical protein
MFGFGGDGMAYGSLHHSGQIVHGHHLSPLIVMEIEEVNAFPSKSDRQKPDWRLWQTSLLPVCAPVPAHGPGTVTFPR